MSSTNEKHRGIGKLFRGVCAGIFGLLTLAGCSSSPKTYEIKGQADPIINRDISGKPLSVVVRVYQLKDAGEFSKLTFDTLASGRPESELLGQDLLEKNEVILVPGGQYVSQEKIRDDAKYIGVVAFFRQPDQHYWRYLVEADKARSNGLNFKVQDCYLMLANIKPSPIPGQPANAQPACANPNIRSGIPAISNAASQSGNAATRPGNVQQNRDSLPAKATTLIEQTLFSRP